MPTDSLQETAGLLGPALAETRGPRPGGKPRRGRGRPWRLIRWRPRDGGGWRATRRWHMEGGELTFLAGLPSPEPILEGAPWDPASAPRGPAGTRYSLQCKNTGSRSPQLVSHGKETPPAREHFRQDAARPLAPGMRSPRCQPGGACFRCSGRDRHEVAQVPLNLLTAGQRLSAKPVGGSVCQGAAFRI